MNFLRTHIPEVIVIEPSVFSDERGFFLESYQFELFHKAGISYDFVQDNHSGSHQNILRGLHYQIHQSQGKLIRVVSGEIYDVSVDVRKYSPTFSKWVGVYLSESNKKQVWIPPGFAHGFYVTSNWADVIYKTTNYYAPQWERTIIWNDPDIGIEWPLINGKTPTISEKDSQGTLLQQAELYTHIDQLR